MMRMLVINVGGVSGVVRTVVVGLCVMVGVVMGEPFYRRRDQQDQARYRPVAENNNIVRNLSDATFILSKYGYLNCRVERRRRDADRHGRGPGHQENPQAEAGVGRVKSSHPSGDNSVEGNVSVSEEGSTQVCNDSDVKQAIRNYQMTYNLAPTGLLDQETKQMMSALRCGNADNEETVTSGTPAPTTSGDDGSDNVQNAILSSSSSLESQPASSRRSSSDPIAANRVRDAQRLSKRAINKIRSDHSSHLLRVLKGAGKSQNSKQSRHLRYLQRYSAKLSRSKDSALLLQPWSEEEHVRAKRFIDITAPGNRKDKPMNLAVLEVSEHRPGIAMGTGQGMMFNRDLIRWRLLTSGLSTRIPLSTQKSILRRAFRMWSEVIPLRFIEDLNSHINNVDIEIAFGRRSHQNCARDFDGPGGEIAHTSAFDFVHFDDEEYFMSTRSYNPSGIYLLRVAVHEIGHVLGLHHTNKSQSIMYAIYQGGETSPEIELTREDRDMMQSLYGQSYYKYNSDNDTVYYGWPRQIEDDFGPKPGQSVGIPNNLDSVFFDFRDKNIYFFKDDLVYVFNPQGPQGSYGCCERIRSIQEEFPSAPDSNVTLGDRLDAVYYSYSRRTQYFFKGENFWRNRLFNPYQQGSVNNSVEFMGKWYDVWMDICDVYPH